MIIHQSHPYNDQNQHPIFNSTLAITMIVHESYSYNLQNRHPIYISTLTTLSCRLDTPTKQKNHKFGQMYNTATYYNHLKPLEILHAPPCLEIQHPILSLDPTFASRICEVKKIKTLNAWIIRPIFTNKN